MFAQVVCQSPITQYVTPEFKPFRYFLISDHCKNVPVALYGCFTLYLVNKILTANTSLSENDFINPPQKTEALEQGYSTTQHSMPFSLSLQTKLAVKHSLFHM